MIEIGGNASIRARKVIDMLEKEFPNDFLETLKKKTCDWREESNRTQAGSFNDE